MFRRPGQRRRELQEPLRARGEGYQRGESEHRRLETVPGRSAAVPDVLLPWLRHVHRERGGHGERSGLARHRDSACLKRSPGAADPSLCIDESDDEQLVYAGWSLQELSMMAEATQIAAFG